MNTNKSKKSARTKLLITICVISAVMLLLIGLSIVIGYFEKNKNAYDEQTIDFDFYPADFDENIYDDAEYFKSVENGFIKYTDAQSGITVGISKSNSEDYGKSTAFMVDMIYNIVEGNTKEYNDGFSSEYYKNHSPKQDFTMQRLYDVSLILISEEAIDNYTKYVFTLEYKIDKNNGTFRSDIGNGSKKQYIELTAIADKIEIQSLSTVKVS